jgi:hypothetical protein
MMLTRTTGRRKFASIRLEHRWRESARLARMLGALDRANLQSQTSIVVPDARPEILVNRAQWTRYHCVYCAHHLSFVQSLS